MRRMTRAVVAAAMVACLLVASACTGGDPNPSISSEPSASLPPGVQLSPDPAPAASSQPVAMRVNSIRRLGDVVRLDLTMAVGNAPFPERVDSPTFDIVTNDGVAVEVTDEAGRSIAPNSTATMVVQAHVPSPSATSLSVTWNDASLSVPLPSGDGTTVWRAAPLRQTGLPETLLPSERLGIALDTIRSEGLVTEVSFHAWNLNDFGSTAPCAENYHRTTCKLTEPDGTVHQVLAGTSTDHPSFGRMTGTIRFLGELKPQTTSVQVYLAAVDRYDPVTVPLPSHSDSPAQAVAGSLSRAPVILNPVKVLTSKQTGARVTIDRVDVLADRVQVHIKAKGGREGIAFRGKEGRTPTLVEPSGVAHTFVPPNGAELVVKPGGSMQATLVFAGAVAADTTSLELTLGVDWGYSALRTKLAIPQVDSNPPAPEATLAQLDQPAAAPVTVPELTASPEPSTAAVTGLDVVPGPLSTDVELGAVRTFITGASSGRGTPEDPSAAEDAERSLEELGAKRTPDGWVLTLPETVLFDYNSADLRPDANVTLTRIATLLNHFSKVKIGVNGHTDNTGAKDYNADLSTKRAQAVAAALAADGVASGRMTVTGFGETRPVASNAGDQGRQKNRRVEIVLRQAD